MKCPFCGVDDNKVVDSRSDAEGSIIRRRRVCLNCQKRFTTHEQVDLPLMVVKKDGSRQSYDRNKILRGLRAACEKRPVSLAQLEAVVDIVERTLHNKMTQEVTAVEIGEIVMEELKKLDHVAYVRFASVYRQFSDVQDFQQIVEILKH